MHSHRSSGGASFRKNFLRLPAVRALLAQAVAFAIVLALAFALPILAGVELSIAFAALIQGGLAAFLARAQRLAPWWMPIQFLFPVALLVLGAAHLPPSIYLGGFLVLLCLYWSTFRTQVPYYPSSGAAWRTVEALLPTGRSLRVIDIGSGFGGLVMYLAKVRPESEIIGIEVAPLPWAFSQLRARLRGSVAHFVRGDYEALDFGEYDVVFAYLSPAAMPRLWIKAGAEMRQGALLLSHEFIIPEVDPDIVVRPPEGGPAIYGWHIR
ncbi:MAG TPA: methyltransferase domain-containing protein [Noviherbaspirillum sp.]|nr:methyltransferase domain-containing protein [Noviherbaspirillum sp.]